MPTFDGARCAEPGVDPEMFFDPNRVDDAIELCWHCPARAECRSYALAEPVEGVWGGTTGVERRAGRPRRLVGLRDRPLSTSPAAIAKRAERARARAAAAA